LEAVMNPNRRGLRPVGWAFLVFGGFWGSWGVAAADVEHALGLSHGGFGVLLSVALLGAGVTNALGGALAERHGSGRVLAASMAGWAALLTIGAVAPGRHALAVAMIAVVTMGGLVDVVMNVAATAAFADDPGGLVRFHARFNGGAAVGAVAMGVLLANGASWRWAWVAVAAGAAFLAVVAARADLPAGAPGGSGSLTDSVRVLRAERLVLIAVAFAVGAMVEGGVDLWGVLFLRTYLNSGIALAAGSAAAAYAVATLARVVIGPSAARRGAARGVTAGAATAAAGVIVVAASNTAWISGLGLVLAAGGISMCWPLLLAVASAGRDRPGQVVGGVSAVGYLGFVLGPTVVGWLAAAFGLRVGLLLLAAAAVFVAASPSTRTRSRNG
jgi:MFS family permease